MRWIGSQWLQTLNLKARVKTKRWAPGNESLEGSKKKGRRARELRRSEPRWSRRLNDASRSAGPVRGCLAIVGVGVWDGRYVERRREDVEVRGLRQGIRQEAYSFEGLNWSCIPCIGCSTKGHQAQTYIQNRSGDRKPHKHMHRQDESERTPRNALSWACSQKEWGPRQDLPLFSLCSTPHPPSLLIRSTLSSSSPMLHERSPYEACWGRLHLIRPE